MFMLMLDGSRSTVWNMAWSKGNYVPKHFLWIFI